MYVEFEMRAFIAIGCCALLSACFTTKPQVWNKPNATQQDLVQDKNGCLEATWQFQSNPAAHPALFSSCMKAYGWELTAQR